MSEEDQIQKTVTKPGKDSAETPVLYFDIDSMPFGEHYAILSSGEHAKFIRKYNLKNKDQFWLSDEHRRILATLDTELAATPRARIHWGKCQPVIVNGNEG